MPYALLQTNHAKGTLNTATGVGQTYNGLSFSNSVAPASLLMLSVCYDQGATVTGVSGGGTWARVGTSQNDPTNSQNAETWYCANATGGSTTPVITYDSGSTGFAAAALVIAEFSGVRPVTPLDVSNTAKAFATSATGTDANTTNAVTVSIADSLGVAIYLGTAGVAPTITEGTGWSMGIAEPGTVGLTGATVLIYRSADPGSLTGTFTSNLNTDRYTGQIAVFKPTGTVLVGQPRRTFGPF